MTVVERLDADSQWHEAGDVLRALRPHLDPVDFAARRDRLMQDGLRLLGVRTGGRLVAVASYTISPHALLGRELLIHDMATLPSEERKGNASCLIERLMQIAEAEDCGRIFVHTKQAQTLYLRNGFHTHSTGLIWQR